MQILSPQQVKQKKALAEREAQRTLRDINIRIEEARRELVQIQTETAELQKRQEGEIEARNQRIIDLNREITILENKRREEMVPVEKMKNKLAAEIVLTQEARAAFEHESATVKRSRSRLMNDREKFLDDKQFFKEQQKELEKRILGVVRQEATLDHINNDLQEKLKQYHENVIQHNAQVAAEREQISQREHAVAVLKESCQKWENELQERERALKDKYETFERSVNRLTNET